MCQKCTEPLALDRPGASVAKWLEHAVAVREVFGLFSVGADTKTFAKVGNQLTTSVYAGLSKDTGFIHLIQKIQDTKPNTT